MDAVSSRVHKKTKDLKHEEKTSSKKRRLEEQSQSQRSASLAVAEMEDVAAPEHRKKKRRRSEKIGDNAAGLEMTTSQVDASQDSEARATGEKTPKLAPGVAGSDHRTNGLGSNGHGDSAVDKKLSKEQRKHKKDKRRETAVQETSRQGDVLEDNDQEDTLDLAAVDRSSHGIKEEEEESPQKSRHVTSSRDSKRQQDISDGVAIDKPTISVSSIDRGKSLQVLIASRAFDTSKPHSAAPVPGSLERSSPFVRTTSSLLLPLASPSLAYPIPGLCSEHLSPLLLTYYPPLKGIVLSYTNPRLHAPNSSVPPYLPPPDRDELSKDGEAKQHAAINATPTSWDDQPLVLATTVDEYNTPFISLTADFTLLRPRKGVHLVGTVAVQNPSWLGLVCWNWFNAGIPAKRLPSGWRWIDFDDSGIRAAITGRGTVSSSGMKLKGEPDEDVAVDETAEDSGTTIAHEQQEQGRTEDLLPGEGCWVDEKGAPVRGEVEFTLRDFEHQPTTSRDSGFVSFEGTLLGEEDEARVDKELRDELKAARKPRKSRREPDYDWA